jgi:uncharacterized protein
MKLVALRTSSVARVAAAILAAGVLFATGTDARAARACEVRFVSTDAALEQGLNAYRAGYFGVAATALACAAENGSFLAQYHLAHLYANSANPLADHKRAYDLYRRIVDDHAATIDVDDDGRAPYVGKALTAFAGYWLRGLPEIGLQANSEQAAYYFQQAATFFRDPDGQFELAKLYITGDGVPEDHKKALNWLAVLTQDAHAGAQAFFAELLWRGKVVTKDEQRALALITVAVENAPAHERLWIETIYQQIFCGTTAASRGEADALTRSFRNLYAPRDRSEAPDRPEEMAQAPPRTCADGRSVELPKRGDRRASTIPGASADGVVDVRGATRN